MRSDWVVCVMTIAALCGCTATPRAAVLCDAMPAESREGAAFWAELADRPIATNDDALHAILLFLDDADDCTSYDARVESLKSRGVLQPSFDAPADEAIHRGTLAVAITNILGMRGGITMSLTGPSGRYAIRELEFRGLFPPSTPNQIFSGGELVGVIDRLYSHVAGDPSQYPASATRAEMRGRGKIAVAHRTASTAMLEMISPSDEPLYLSIGFTLNQPATTTTTIPATAPSGTFVVTQIEGKGAQAKLEPDAAWQPCAVGMQLSAGGSVRTGLRGFIWIESEGKQFRVGGATVVKIASLIDINGVAATNVEMPHGTINLDLERGGPTGSTTMRTPNTTLAVRGTKVSLYEQRGFEPRALSLTGSAEFENFQRRKVLFGKPRARDIAGNPIVVTADNPDPAAVAFAQTVVDPTLRGARTESEEQLVAQLQSRGSVVTFDRNSGLFIVRGGSVPTNFTPLLRGNFNVVLNWTSDVNLNLGVASPGTDAATPPRPAEFVYPQAGLTRTPFGGLTRFDHQGGGSGGYEIVSFERFDNGSYGVVVENIKPKTPHAASATFRVFLDGEQTTFTANGEFFNPVTEFSIDVGPQSPSVTFIDDVGSGLIFSPFSKSDKKNKSEPFVGPVAPPRVEKPFVGPVRPKTKPAAAKR